MEKQKKDGKQLAEQLLIDPKHLADLHPGMLQKAAAFCGGYKQFLDDGKTEREAAAAAVALLEKAGYIPYEEGKSYPAGAKVYLVNRGRALMAATIGQKSLEEGVRLSIAHIDSPRLDLKPSPLYESDDLAFFKTHYYGGLRKYQWVAVPLSMHGVVVKKDGSMVEVCVGEEAGDPVFCITDLLPHLAAEQSKRTLAEGIKGEELNILVGALPFADPDAQNRVKLETMRILNEKYGITEHDFLRAEIEFVPAHKAADVGFDASLMGGYGQDDRVCAYPALIAEIECKNPAQTTVCVLTDKEETGSDGNTGLSGEYLFHFLESLAEMQKANYRTLLRNSLCLSADVSAAFDPTFPEPFEKQNTCFINRGVALNKYTGGKGKVSTSDASAETMGYFTRLFDRASITWQVGELGKVDAGGGGTIAKFVAARNVDVVDVGVPVLAMHSPFEITSKLDIYSTFLAFKAFAGDTEML